MSHDSCEIRVEFYVKLVLYSPLDDVAVIIEHWPTYILVSGFVDPFPTSYHFFKSEKGDGVANNVQIIVSW